MSDYSQGPGWWQASDGKWYAPQGQAAPPQAPPLYGQPYGGQPEQSKAQAAFVLGIISLFINPCFVLGILAIVWGGKEKDYNSRAKTGFILGIIGTALSALWIVIIVAASAGS